VVSLQNLLRRAGICAGITLVHGTASAALLINEIDSDSVNVPSTDAFEFVELFETTGTSVPLDGYVLVFYNGNGNVPYRVDDLDGFSTDSSGYFVAGSISGANYPIPSNTIQNGVDAVALYLGNRADFVTGAGGTAPTKTNLVDAVVYKTGGDTDGVGLDSALLDGGSILDEFGRDGSTAAGAADSLGRVPNGAGAARNTTNWTYMTPTPGLVNVPEPTGLALLWLGALALIGRARVRSS
jgi:hypothetical protein